MRGVYAYMLSFALEEHVSLFLFLHTGLPVAEYVAISAGPSFLPVSLISSKMLKSHSMRLRPQLFLTR